MYCTYNFDIWSLYLSQVNCGARMMFILTYVLKMHILKLCAFVVYIIYFL